MRTVWRVLPVLGGLLFEDMSHQPLPLNGHAVRLGFDLDRPQREPSDFPKRSVLADAAIQS